MKKANPRAKGSLGFSAPWDACTKFCARSLSLQWAGGFLKSVINVAHKQQLLHVNPNYEEDQVQLRSKSS